jgi:hypothetical protein
MGPYGFMPPSERLNRIEGKIDALTEDMTTIKAGMPVLSDHENRIRILERWRYALPPAILLALITAAKAFADNH